MRVGVQEHDTGQKAHLSFIRCTTGWKADSSSGVECKGSSG